mmetsp:Transcript_64647/g.119026  ORF Transcript_64647/g.119026 Transcript_64647/m.119026 type:complete len:255 (+) Transcript_64647:290-1054(+)
MFPLRTGADLDLRPHTDDGNWMLREGPLNVSQSRARKPHAPGTPGPFFDLENAGGKNRSITVKAQELPERYSLMRMESEKRFRGEGGERFGLFVSTDSKVGPGKYIRPGQWLSTSTSVPAITCDKPRLYSTMKTSAAERFRFKGGENFGLFIGSPAHTGPASHARHTDWLPANTWRDNANRYSLMRDTSDRRFRGTGGEGLGLFVGTSENLGPGQYIQHSEWIKPDKKDKGTLEIDPWSLIKTAADAKRLGATF